MPLGSVHQNCLLGTPVLWFKNVMKLFLSAHGSKPFLNAGTVLSFHVSYQGSLCFPLFYNLSSRISLLLQISNLGRSALPLVLLFFFSTLLQHQNSNREMEILEKTGEEMAMEIDDQGSISRSSKILDLLRRFLSIQQRRAEAYSRLRSGFAEYMLSGGDLAYQQLCSEITMEFNNCSKPVLEMESMLLNRDFCRDDLAALLKAVQAQEKQKLHLSAPIQFLKKAGRPSERLVNREHCRFRKPAEHECVHVHELTEAMGTEDAEAAAEADAEYDGALKEAIKGVQDAVTSINEHLEEVRYEIEALEAE